jgi:hypothetical protein
MGLSGECKNFEFPMHSIRRCFLNTKTIYSQQISNHWAIE